MIDLITGGLTGLLGTAITGVTAYFDRRQRHQQEVELRRLDLEIEKHEAASAERRAAIEAEVAKAVAETEARAEADAAAYGSMRASYRDAARRWSSGESRWLVAVDVVRGLTRPMLTLLFVGLVGWIYGTLGTESEDLRTRVVETVMYVSTTTVLWWFGARHVSRAGR